MLEIQTWITLGSLIPIEEITLNVLRNVSFNNVGKFGERC